MNGEGSTANLGAVVSVRGSVVDVRFDERLPPTHHAIECSAAEKGLYFGESPCKAYMRDGRCDAKSSVQERCASQSRRPAWARVLPIALDGVIESPAASGA